MWRALRIFIASLTLAVAAECLLAQTAARMITPREAKALNFAMLKADDWNKLPGFSIQPWDDPRWPKFYLIDADSDNPNGSGTIGH
jgi:hypothetical protein